MATPAPGVPPPSAPAPAPRVELRALAVQPGQQARQLQVLQPAGTVAQAPALQPPADPDAQDRLVKRRVLFVSVAIAVWVVFGSFLDCAFDTAAIEDAFAKIQSVTQMNAGSHRMAAFVMSRWREVVWSIAFNLLVPLCGYLGVKRNEQCLLGWFCGCNALHCCCAIWFLVSLMCFLFGLSAATPEIFNYLDTCDPMQCAPRGFNHTARDHLVDCLAANTWKDYQPRFGKVSEFPEMCPKIFLQCKTGSEVPRDPWAMDQGHEPPLLDGFEGVDGVASKDMELHHENPFVEGIAEGMTEGMAKGMAVGGPTGVGGGTASGFLGRKLSIRREAFLSESPGAPVEAAHRFRRRHHHEWPVPPKPEDPLTQCKPAETVEFFHQTRILAPQLLTKLVLFLAMKLVLLIPVILLGCFGFCWGMELWARLGQGYAQLQGPPPGAPVEVPLQPLVAIAVPQQASEADLAQPLMLNAPPPLPVLQQGVVAGQQPGQAASSLDTTDQE
mmetsp:Transcript_81267/g.188779  ORF Transcript_81267/g.188779 Transcript_81267/m.188779 type:complete len:499 (+) Transcript_81267:61-1557(+)